MKKKTLDIGEVIKASGLPASTLRYYEEKKLIRSVGRRGLRRIFAESVVDQLALISLGRFAGFSLDEIAGMMQADSTLTIDRTQLEEKAAELEQTIKRLSAMRKGLLHAARCEAPSHLECDKFRRLIRAASKRRPESTSKST